MLWKTTSSTHVSAVNLNCVNFQGYGRAVKLEEVSEVEVVGVVEDRHLNVNVSSSGQGTRTVVLQIPKVKIKQVVEREKGVKSLNYL